MRCSFKPAAGAPRPKAVSMGPVTSATLRKLGYEIAAEAPTATLDSLVETICQFEYRIMLCRQSMN